MKLESHNSKRRPGCNINAALLSFTLMLMCICALVSSCTKEEGNHHASLFLKTGTSYTFNKEEVKLGGLIRIGVLASGAGSPLTYLRIECITNADTIVQIDRGIYIGNEGLDEDFTFSKDTSSREEWRVIVMNADRDTAVRTLMVLRGSGSDWGEINSYEHVELGLQENPAGNWFLDLDAGLAYTSASVVGQEQDIDVMAYYYVTSGLPSPSLTCPGYTAAVGYYPGISSWTVKNNTLFDYLSTDNNLVSVEQYNLAVNDSLLVTAYQPAKVSGNCKYCYSDKVIPFRTTTGKYGLIKVEQADHFTDGIMRLSVKIQK